jgi:hypothetical protein
MFGARTGYENTRSIVMDMLGRLLIFGGFILAVAAQIYIVILAFKRSFGEGLLCFIVPAYVLFWAMRQETRQPKFLVAWASGLVACISGIAVLSI